MKVEDPIIKVQNAYEKTLEEATLLSPTTDQLVRRFSRELKIRRHSDQKVVRSPSARKIGTIRRRSRELERKQELRRNQSWHVSHVDILPRVSLKHGQPNTPLTGLKTPNKEFTNNMPLFEESPLKRVTRASSFQNKIELTPIEGSQNKKESFKVNCSNKSTSRICWTSGDNFFDSGSKTQMTAGENCRASIAKLRKQNAGMVLAKAKLFDELVDSDTSQKSQSSFEPPPKVVYKIGTERQSHRVRTLLNENRRNRNSMTPRRKNTKSPTSRAQKLQLAKQIRNENKLILQGKENDKYSSDDNTWEQNYILKDISKDTTPDLLKKSPCTSLRSNVPYIKKSLNVKSPKRLVRTPQVRECRQTPLKAIFTKFNEDL